MCGAAAGKSAEEETLKYCELRWWFSAWVRTRMLRCVQLYTLSGQDAQPRHFFPVQDHVFPLIESPLDQTPSCYLTRASSLQGRPSASGVSSPWLQGISSRSLHANHI